MAKSLHHSKSLPAQDPNVMESLKSEKASLPCPCDGDTVKGKSAISLSKSLSLDQNQSYETPAVADNYEITVYEDVGHCRQCRNKNIPVWAKNDEEIMHQLFKQIFYRDHDRIYKPFPQVPPGYKLFE